MPVSIKARSMPRNDYEQGLWWVMGWLGQARVIRPAELREMVLGQLEAGMRLNQA
jgi:hypothetical protein